MEDQNKELYLRFLDILNEFDDITCPKVECSECIFGKDIYFTQDMESEYKADLCEVLTNCSSRLL